MLYPFIHPDTAQLLEEAATRINRPEFIDKDPVQFPRRFSRLQDIEIVSLLVSLISWGSRPMICRDAERMLKLMDYDPYNYVMEKGYEDLDPGLNIHRTFFGRHFRWLLSGLHLLYSSHSSMDAFVAERGLGSDPAPAWRLGEELRNLSLQAAGGVECPGTLPSNFKTTALKRINMALRWLVRDDGIVDLGVWKSLTPAQLYIPFDVHVGNTARELGILTRRTNDRKAVEILTGSLRHLRPDDPVFFDYALFGIGVEKKWQGK